MMGEVVTYSCTETTAFCQLKLDSGERILISLAGSPGPSIKIVKLALGGLIPVKTIWGTDSPGRETLRLFGDRAYEVDSGKGILDLYKDELIRCKSIAEVRQRLS